MDSSQNFSTILSNSGSPPTGGLSAILSDKTPPASQSVTQDQIDATADRENLSPLQRRVMSALVGQESNNGQNAQTSVDGARGVGQVMPDTFRRYAKPGESIDNAEHNLAVTARIVKDLGAKFGDDPAKIAAGYFSGDGNVNAGQGSAWREDRADGNGKRVSNYVADVLKRVGNPAPAQTQDFSNAPDWSKFAQSKDYLDLTPDERQQIKSEYFDKWFAPALGADAAKIRSEFLAQGAKTGPSFGEKVMGVAKDIGNAVMDAVTPTTSVLAGAAPAPDLPTTSKVPVRPELRAAFNAQWDAANPNQREALAQRQDWVGMLARERAGLFERSDAGATPTQQQLDPRAESRAARLATQGEAPEFAQRAAQDAAMAGVAPGREVEFEGKRNGLAQPSNFDFDTQQAFDPNQPANGLNNPLVRGLAKGALGAGKAVAGYGEFLSDAMGRRLEHAGAAMRAGGAAIRNKEDAIGESGDLLSRNFEGAINSLTQQLPLIVTGTKLESEAVPLAGMAMQTFGQEYSDGRAAGQTVGEATTRASIFAAFEVIGEKFGLHENMEAIKAAAQGMPADKIVGFLWDALKKEVPGEVLTTTGQFAADKLPGGIGLNPNATGADYLKQVADTIAQTVMQSGVSAGATTGVSQAIQHLNGASPLQGVSDADAELARQQALNKWNTHGLSSRLQSDVPTAAGTLDAPQIHPTSQTAEAIVRELATQAGIPHETVLPTSALESPAPQSAADQDAMNLAAARYQQLRIKRDMAMAGEGESGAGLSPSEQREFDFLNRARGNPQALRQFYFQAQPAPATGSVEPSPQENPNVQENTAPQQDGPAPGAQLAATGQVTPATAVGGDGQAVGPAGQQQPEPAATGEVAAPAAVGSQRDAGEQVTETEAQREARLEREAIQSEGNHGTQTTQAEQAETQGSPAPATAAVTQAAHEAATSPHNELPEPSQAQKEAGNYRKGHVNFDGLDLTIENPVGSERKGVDPNGQPWSVGMTAHYGYLKRSEGADGDQVDVYLAEHPHTGAPVYVFDQYHADGKFDEHKAVVGVQTPEEARAIYDAHFSDGSGPTRRRAMTEMTVDQFKAWARSGDAKKPLFKPRTEKEAKELRRSIQANRPKPRTEKELREQRANEFVKAPDGSFDFGEITPEMSAAMRRQAGKIRLTRGIQNEKGGYGLAHIEARHGNQIRALGYQNVPEFVKEIAGHFSEVWQAAGTQLLVTAKENRKDVMYVQLDIAPEGDYYRVNSAFPVRREDYEAHHGMKMLWPRSEPGAKASGRPSTFAAGNAESSSSAGPNAVMQSEASVPKTEKEAKARRAAKATVAQGADKPKTEKEAKERRRVQNDQAPKDVQAEAPADQAGASARSDETRATGVPDAAGSAGVEAAGVNAAEAPSSQDWARARQQAEAEWNGMDRGQRSYKADQVGYGQAVFGKGKQARTLAMMSWDELPNDAKRVLAISKLTKTADKTEPQSKHARRDVDQRARADAKAEIKDFGEKIGGARKDVWASFQDDLGTVADNDIASQPLSKVWPQPDYQALLDGGADPWAVAFARAARDEIPSKPRQLWKVKRWAEQVRSLRDTTMKLMDGSLSVERAKHHLAQFASRGMSDLAGRVELYMLVGHRKSLDGVRIRSGEYSFYNRIEYNPPRVIWTVEKEAAATAFSNWPRELAQGATRDEALKAFKEKYDALDINPPASKETTFDVYSRRGEGGYWVGKKVGRNPIFLAGPFDNIKAARDYKANNQAELVAKLEKSKEIPRERRDTNEPRVGEDMRNGQDVTPQMFGETFGFRGVEFGNWVEQDRRQKDLNDAFDALMDMAAIIGVPPKALSLNGELGLAFGARGGGGVNPAAAHYERDKVVINLTKRAGAGSLGHEWWHALDNYFSRMRSKSGDMMTDALDVSLVSRGAPFEHRGAVRKEMVEAFGAVMKAIKQTAMKARAAKLDAKRNKEYWTTDPEMSARAFESYLISKLQDQEASNDYLANIVDPETWKAAETLGFELDDSYPYPTAGEIPAIRAGFDHFFQTIETRETDKGVAIYSQSGRSVGHPLGLRASVSTIEDELEKRLEGLAHRPEVRVLESAVGTLPGARDEDGIAGANWQGRIYLFRDQLGSRFDVQRTLFHELLHYGLRRFLSREQFIAQMDKLYRRDDYIKSEADAWVKTAKGQETAQQFGNAFARARGVDEALATLAEPNQGGYLKTDLVSRAKVAVTRWLAAVAETLGFKEYAARIRSYKNEEARQFVQEIFGKLREDADPHPDAWSDGDMPFSSRPQALNSVQSASEPWTVTEPGAGDDFIRAIQDNKIDVKRVRDAIAERYGRLADEKDVYLNEELYHGRVAAKVDRLYEGQVEPILRKIAESQKNLGVTIDDVNTYLHARHAPERNAAMKAINPNMQDNDALSGMSDQEAAKVMADFKAAGKDKALGMIASDVDQLLADTRTNLVADGLEDAGVVAAWESAYKHYVPLQRDIKSSGTPKGMGFSVRGPESKHAVGSNRQVVNILANIVAQAETAAIRAEKAVVGRTLLAMAREYPNKDFWTVDVAPTKPRFNKETGLVERDVVDPLYQTADNVVMVKDYGQQHFIVFNKNNQRAMAMAHAMKNLDIAPMNKILEVSSQGTRFLASLLTQRNPLFWITNFSRDVQGALINLEGTEAEGLQSKVMTNMPKAFKGMHAVVRGEGKGDWARYAREFKEAGGTTGYMQAFGDSNKRMADLRKEVDKMGQGNADPRRLARMALDFVDDYNDIIENAVRLSVFQTARQAGVSTPRAASIAKNITVNFSCKGNLTPAVNGLYMFFNANVQSTARLMQVLATSNRGRVLVAGIVAMGFFLDMVCRMIAGDDDETGRNRYDLIPEFEKSRNWIFMDPMHPGGYVKVPLPLGPHFFFNVGRLVSDAIFRKDSRNASEYGWSMAGALLDAFSPFGTSPSLPQLIAPSVLDPAVQLAENKSFTGAPIYKSSDQGFGKTDPKPAYLRHFESTPGLWVNISKMLNNVSGGDKVKPGAIDVSPDIMKHVFYTMTGGPGRTLDQAIDIAQGASRGKDFSVNRVPLLSRFYGENDDVQRERAYYDEKKRVLDAKQTFDYYIKNGRRDEAQKVAIDLGNGDEAQGRRKMLQFSISDKSIRKINDAIRLDLGRDDDGSAQAEQLRALRQRRTSVMSNALDDKTRSRARAGLDLVD